MSRTRFRLMVISLACIAVVLSAALPAGAAEDKSVEPTHSGKVTGRVYDAETGAPIQGVTVAVQQDGVFADKGETIGKTDEGGTYKCQAELGRVSSNIDVGRLLQSSLIGLLSGSAKKVTKRIDISRLNLRVSGDGYHGYEGVVTCRTVDPESFSVTMEPILLTRSASSDASTSAKGWGTANIVDIVVDRAILQPNTKVNVTLHVKCPPLPKSAKMNVKYGASRNGDKVREFTTDSNTGNLVLITDSFGSLKMTPGSNPNELTFSGTFTAPKKAVSEELWAWLDGCPYDIRSGGSSVGTLLQVATTSSEEKAAQIRLDAYKLQRDGQSADALTKLQELSALPEATVDDFQNLALTAETVHDYDAAIAAWRQAIAKTEEKKRLPLQGRLAGALLRAGKPDQVISEGLPELEKIKEKDRPKKVPSALTAAIGMAYVQTGKLEEAKKISTDLAKYPDAIMTPSVAEFRRAFRLAEAEAAVTAQPESAQANADYGRVLMDQGRWEEAMVPLRKAVSLDSSLSAVQWDLNYALVHVSGKETGVVENYDEALATAEKQVSPNGKDKSKDFKAWHTLAMLLYRNACVQQTAGDAAAPVTMKRAQDTLVEALKCGRSGKDVFTEGSYYGYFGYFGSKVVGIAGFAYPEANSDLVILESLKILEKNPNDYLAHFNLAVSLLDVGQSDLAAAELNKCIALKPDYLEAKFAKALIAMKAGSDSEALGLLTEVVSANPRHPQANVMLAKLHTQAGDMASASACLAKHAAFYGSAK